MSFSFDRVLVTGGAGFIGSHLVERLHQESSLKIRVLELPGVNTNHLPHERVEFVIGDLCQPDTLQDAVKDCDAIFHLAANPNLWAKDPSIFEAVNHQGTRHLLAAAKAANVKRFIHISTETLLMLANNIDVIDEQTESSFKDMKGPYCQSKWLAEQAVLDAANEHFSVAIVTPTVPVGPGDHHCGSLSRMFQDFLNGRIKAYVEGSMVLIDVRDVAEGIWRAALKNENKARYLLGHERWTIKEVLSALSNVSHRPIPRFKVPYFIALSFAAIEEWICSNITKSIPMATVTGLRLSRCRTDFNPQQTLHALQLSLRPCQPAIENMLKWLQKTI